MDEVIDTLGVKKVRQVRIVEERREMRKSQRLVLRRVGTAFREKCSFSVFYLF